ncbi:hypothetical protein [Arthrobacter wenxiniae]|uniref:Uncharacterized protein n=1 Tax=Arthrobacter wenxiniae TaxID=2713570 RepID=A0A7Y7IFF2_9MICC|nr:hypothetical protein [Arthrobacter wenxiniae]NVM93886.1 hypothetical protein [Arthrobacter wenxiniae]
MVSYVKDPGPDTGAEAAKPNPRPVVFAFTGGPGSSGVWLPMGLLGPRRVDSGDVGALAPAPFGLAELTTLSEDFIRQSNLRWDYSEFSAELLRGQGLTEGRIDGRFTQRHLRGQASVNRDDASMNAITGPYAAAINHYVRTELRYENDMPCEALTGRVQPWSYKTFEGAPVDVTGDLERLLGYNAALRVHVDYGCHDGATPHFAAEYVWAQLNISAEARTRFTHHYHQAGHMMYLQDECRVAQLAALADCVAPG